MGWLQNPHVWSKSQSYLTQLPCSISETVCPWMSSFSCPQTCSSFLIPCLLTATCPVAQAKSIWMPSFDFSLSYSTVRHQLLLSYCFSIFQVFSILPHHSPSPVQITIISYCWAMIIASKGPPVFTFASFTSIHQDNTFKCKLIMSLPSISLQWLPHALRRESKCLNQIFTTWFLLIPLPSTSFISSNASHSLSSIPSCKLVPLVGNFPHLPLSAWLIID